GRPTYGKRISPDTRLEPGALRRDMNVRLDPREEFMFGAFRNFISDIVDGGKHPSQFADDDYRLAAAALLVHAAAIDGEMSAAERDKLHAVVKQRFALGEAATDELIDKA